MIGIWTNLSPDHKDRYMSLFGGSSKQSASAEGRLTGMVNEFVISAERPIVGHGLGTTGEAKFHAGYPFQVAHNLYAELLIEIGVIGFVLFIRFLYSIYKLFHANRDSISKAVDEQNDDHVKTFEYRLISAFVAVFWMYAVYSINYWGLSIYYWYFFGGLTVAFSRIYFIKASHRIKKAELIYENR